MVPVNEVTPKSRPGCLIREALPISSPRPEVTPAAHLLRRAPSSFVIGGPPTRIRLPGRGHRAAGGQQAIATSWSRAPPASLDLDPELEGTLGRVSESAFRANDRLSLEKALISVVRDLDGALELVELMVEASATGRVPVAVTDVIRESANRFDTGSGRGRRLRVTFSTPGSPVLVRVNPRLALRLFAFAVALAAGKDGVHVRGEFEDGACMLRVSSPSTGGEAVLVAIPPLIELSRFCAREVAAASGALLDATPGERAAVLTLPLDPGE